MFRGKQSSKQLTLVLIAASLILSGCSGEASSPSPSVPETLEQEIGSKYALKVAPVFSEPWPTQVTRQEMIETALAKGFEYLDTLPLKECRTQPKIFIGETILQEHHELINGISIRMNQIFCDYLTEDFTVIAGGYDYVEQVIREESLPSDEFGGVCGYPIAPGNDAGRACAVNGVAWIGKTIGTKRMGKLMTDETAVSVVAHEIFHVVHDAIDPGPASQSPPPGDPFYRPVWLIEGGGEFFGRFIPKYLDLQDYGTFTPSDRSGAALRVDYLSDLSRLELRAPGGGPDNYYSGQVALEYITASVGMEALLDVWVRMGKGKQFEDAFEGALGITVADFYGKFRQMHDNLYEGELVE